MEELNMVELFSGSGTMSGEFKRAGYKTFSVDIRKRKGICEPDLQKNILQLKVRDIPFDKVHVVWASPPCDVFSIAAGNFHWYENGTPKTEKAKEHIEILKKTLLIIEKLQPDIFFIENPRGKMRYNKFMIDFLIKARGHVKELTYSSYGFPTKKPTNIFTNALDYQPKKLDTFGRGAKNSDTILFDNMTKCQKQKVPGSLAKEVRLYCENKLLGNDAGTYYEEKVNKLYDFLETFCLSAAAKEEVQDKIIKEILTSEEEVRQYCINLNVK